MSFPNLPARFTAPAALLCALACLVGCSNSSNSGTPGIVTGNTPESLAIDLTNHLLYVANVGATDKTVSVINTTTGSRAGSITLPAQINDVAINPTNHKVYVAVFGNNTVAVAGSSNQVSTTIPVGRGPGFLAVDPQNNLVYVTNETDGTVSIIDSALDTVLGTVPVGSNPGLVAVGANAVYVVNLGSGTVSVLSTGRVSPHVITTIAGVSTNTTRSGMGIVVEPFTNRVYISDQVDGKIIVINGNNNSLLPTITQSGGPDPLLIDSARNLLFVGLENTNQIAVLNSTTGSAVTTLSAPGEPDGLALDPSTGKLYVSAESNNRVITVNTSSISAQPTPVR